MAAVFAFSATVWQWMARHDAWFFVSVPEEQSDEIRARSEGLVGGFNSVPVEVAIGDTRWRTSIFPGGDGVYWLPLKKSVRAAEGIERDSVVDVAIELRLTTP